MRISAVIICSAIPIGIRNDVPMELRVRSALRRSKALRLSVVQHPDGLGSTFRVGVNVLEPLGSGLGERHGKRETALLQRATLSMPVLADIRRRIGADDWAQLHAELCACARARLVERGQMLVASPADLATSFFIILRGTVSVLQMPPPRVRGAPPPAEPPALGVLGPGACVTEATQLWLSPLAAGAKALETLELIELPNALRSSGTLKREYLSVLHERAAFALTLPLLRDCAQLKPLVMSARLLRARVGETVIWQGEPCEGLTLVLEGSLSATVTLLRKHAAPSAFARPKTAEREDIALKSKAEEEQPLGADGPPLESHKLANVGEGQLLSLIDVFAPLIAQAKEEARDKSVIIRRKPREAPRPVHSASVEALTPCKLLFFPTDMVLRHAGRRVLTEFLRQAEERRLVRAALLKAKAHAKFEQEWAHEMRAIYTYALGEEKPAPRPKPVGAAKGAGRGAGSASTALPAVAGAVGSAGAYRHGAVGEAAEATARPALSEAERQAQALREEQLRLPHLVVGARTVQLGASGQWRPLAAPASLAVASGGRGGGVKHAATGGVGRAAGAELEWEDLTASAGGGEHGQAGASIAGAAGHVALARRERGARPHAKALTRGSLAVEGNPIAPRGAVRWLNDYLHLQHTPAHAARPLAEEATGAHAEVAEAAEARSAELGTAAATVEQQPGPETPAIAAPAAERAVASGSGAAAAAAAAVASAGASAESRAAPIAAGSPPALAPTSAEEGAGAKQELSGPPLPSAAAEGPQPSSASVLREQELSSQPLSPAAAAAAGAQLNSVSAAAAEGGDRFRALRPSTPLIVLAPVSLSHAASAEAAEQVAPPGSPLLPHAGLRSPQPLPTPGGTPGSRGGHRGLRGHASAAASPSPSRLRASPSRDMFGERRRANAAQEAAARAAAWEREEVVEQRFILAHALRGGPAGPVAVPAPAPGGVGAVDAYFAHMCRSECGNSASHADAYARECSACKHFGVRWNSARMGTQRG